MSQRDDISKKMIAYRKSLGLTERQVGDKLHISHILVRYLENHEVTHPNIARRVGEFYKLSEEETYLLMPKNYRPGPNYEPDKYKLNLKITNKRGEW